MKTKSWEKMSLNKLAKSFLAGLITYMAMYQQEQPHPGAEATTFHDQGSPHHYQLEQHQLDQQQQQRFHQQQPVYDGESQLQYSTEPDDPSNFQREMEEEGAFVSTNEAP